MRYMLCFLLLAMTAAGPAYTVKQYTVLTGVGILSRHDDTVIVLRRFVRDSAAGYLAVNPKSLSTAVIDSGDLVFAEASWQLLYRRFAATPYIRALKQAESLGDSLQNAGIRRFPQSPQGINLTIDLCPARKPLDRFLFTEIIREIGPAQKPVPVALAAAGQWMNSHRQDVHWLTGLADSGDLAITWINHSYNHYSNDSLPLTMNFLLEKGTDLTAEVLKTEITLLTNGIVPSVFFRFPGLVSEKAVFTKIIEFGLIPVGSDAWLSKGQRPGNGSIVLVHGNGNDQAGVHAVIQLLKRERPNICAKKWSLLDLKTSVAENAGK